MDFLSKLINRPKSLVVSSADQMDPSVPPPVGNGAEIKSTEPQARSSAATKKPSLIDQTINTVRPIEDTDSIEKQIKEDISTLTQKRNSEGDEHNPDKTHHGKSAEDPNQKLINTLTVLPDIVNIQPIIVTEDSEDNRTTCLNDDSHPTQSESKGYTSLTVPSITCDAVSSDEELFAECELYTDQQMPQEDEFSRSAHWDTVLSNVTSSNLENLENIEHTNDRGVSDTTLYLESDPELATESGVEEKSGMLGNAITEKTHSPDSTLKYESNEAGEIRAFDKTSDLSLCKGINSLSCDEDNIEASVSSTIISTTLGKDCGDSGIGAEEGENYINKTVILDSPKNANSVTSELSVKSNINDIKELYVEGKRSPPEITDQDVSIVDKTSNMEKLNKSQSPKIDLKQASEKITCPSNINENSFNTNSLNTTIDLNQTTDLSPCQMKYDKNIHVDHFSTTFDATISAQDSNQTVELSPSSASADANQTVYLNHSLSKGKPGTNLDAPKIMSDTIIVSAASDVEPMDVDYVASPARIECIIPPKCDQETLRKSQGTFVENLTNPMDVTFVAPLQMVPPGKRRSIDPPSEADFQGHGLILNPSDFDFLLSKGSNFIPVDDRNSLLLRFDPLVGHSVPVNQPQIYNQILSTSSQIKERLSTATEEEEDVHNSRNIDQLPSEGPVLQEGINNASNVVNVQKSVKDELLKNIKKEDLLVIKGFKVKDLKELVQGDDKMSVDVIQDVKIENDSKTEDNLKQKTENNQEYKMDDLEKKIKNEVLKTEDIEKKLKDAEQREEALLKRITEKDKTIAKMSGVIEAYEKAIAELIAEKEQIIQNYEKEMTEIKAERDLNYKHLTSLESTFTDLHAKYERSKQLTAKLKASEEDLNQEKKKNLENLRLQEQRYEKMKSHAMQQLEIANNKIESLTKNHAIEVTRLKALLKKEEISRLSVNEQLQQKTRENEELMKICDELINGQGASS